MLAGIHLQHQVFVVSFFITQASSTNTVSVFSTLSKLKFKIAENNLFKLGTLVSQSHFSKLKLFRVIQNKPELLGYCMHMGFDFSLRNYFYSNLLLYLFTWRWICTHRKASRSNKISHHYYYYYYYYCSVVDWTPVRMQRLLGYSCVLGSQYGRQFIVLLLNFVTLL